MLSIYKNTIPKLSYKKLRYVIKHSGSYWVQHVDPSVFGILPWMGDNISIDVYPILYSKDHIGIMISNLQKYYYAMGNGNSKVFGFQYKELRHLMYHRNKQLYIRYTKEEIDLIAKEAIRKVGWERKQARGNIHSFN